MSPDPKACGLLAAGRDPYQIDYILTYMMGFDPERIALLREARTAPDVGFDPWSLETACFRKGTMLDPKAINLAFEPHPAWRGVIERSPDSQP
jgi:hypothetical protein